jgi:hypothetical protein
MSNIFTKVDIERLVRLFAAKLHEAGVEGTIKILGGAAIALLYYADRRTTSDIDALYPADDRVAEIIHQVGREEGLSEGWINNQVQFVLPFEGNTSVKYWQEYFNDGSIIVQVATAEFLLALKLYADRGLRDRQDTEKLIQICELTTIQEIEDIFESYFPDLILKAETREVVERMLESREIDGQERIL